MLRSVGSRSLRRPGGRCARLLLALVGAVAAVLPLAAAHAQADAFSIEVAVSDRSDGQQREAFALAMRRVLLDNSGDKTLLNRSDVRNGVRDAESYVEQFRYRAPEPGTVIDQDVPVTEQVRQSGEATGLMLVRFDRERILALIDGDDPADEADSEALPATDSALVWLLIEDGPRDILVTGDNVINVQRRAIEIAGGAGVSLRFPAGDERAVDAITAEDLRILPALPADTGSQWPADSGKPGASSPAARPADTAAGVDATAGAVPDGTDPAEAEAVAGEAAGPDAPRLQRLRRAAERYAEPQILIGHIQRQPLRGWKSAWQRLDEPVEGENETRFTSDSLDMALQSGLQWLIPTLADNRPAGGDARYADQRPASQALVWIGSLDTTQSYARTLQFLTAVDGVERVYPKLASADGMVFALSPRSALGNLDAALPGVDWLRPIATPQVASQTRLGRNSELALDYIGPAGN